MKSNFSTRCMALIINFLVISSSLISIGCRSVSNDPSLPFISVSSRQIVNDNVVLDNALDQTISIQNIGSATLNIGRIAQANPLEGPFSIMNDNCSGRSLPGSGTCTLQVRFKPIIQGSFKDTFDIPSDALNENPVTVSVSGNGKALRVTINQVKTDQCPNVELLMTVMNKNNNLVSGLTPSNFQLFENGVDLTKAITSVSLVPPPPTPVSISLVMDYSTSLQNQVADMETAARSFIGTMSSSDEASIIKFATAWPVYQTFTSDTNALYQAIAIPYSGDRNETHLYDALWSAVDETGSKNGNIRALVVISDGVDTNIASTGPGSARTLPGVIAHATEKNIAIFAIGLGNVNGGVMNQLAAGTGGQYFYAPSPDQLNYSAIKSVLSGQYSVKYSSSSRGSIMLDVMVTDYTNGNEGKVSRQVPGCQ